jgi:hypothetical protein
MQLCQIMKKMKEDICCIHSHNSNTFQNEATMIHQAYMIYLACEQTNTQNT